MKTLTKFRFISLFVMLLWGSTQLKAQCQASFTYVDHGNGSITFTNTSSYPDTLVIAVWEIGNGNYATGDSFTQTFSNGVYQVCLTVNDSIYGGTCTSSFCDSVVVTNGTPEPIDSCNISVSYTYSDDSAGTYTFSPNITGGGAPYTYEWNFGDQTPLSYSQSPIHTFAYDNIYDVCLTVIDNDTNCLNVFCDSLLVEGNPCIINASIYVHDSLQYGMFEVYNTSENCFWDFGDGELSSDSSNYQEHFYNSPGTYYYCVTIGECSPVCDSITIREECDFNLYSSYSASSGVASFDAEGVGINDIWDFGDGSSIVGTDVSHTYSTPGTYYYCFTRDNCDPICDSIMIPTYCEANPVHSFFNINNYGDSNIVIDNFSSTGTGISYLWEYTDGSTSNGQLPNFTFTEDGLLCLTVSDSLCESVSCDSIIVSCNVLSGFTYTDNGGGNYSFSSISTGNIAAHLWSFGGSTSNLLSPSYSFPMDGTYLVSLYVADSNYFCSDYYTDYITVTGVSNPVECNASFTIFTDSLYNGVYVANTSGGNNLTYFWDFGDGNTSTLAYPSYTYGSGGPFELCLTVASDSGCTSTYCDSIGAGGVVNKGAGFDINVIAPVVTTINEEVQFVKELNIYPNPVKNKLTIALSLLQSTHVEVVITDLLGNVVKEINNSELSAGNNKLNWNSVNITNGVYLLHVKTGSDLRVKKLVLNR